MKTVKVANARKYLKDNRLLARPARIVFFESLKEFDENLHTFSASAQTNAGALHVVEYLD